MQPSYFFTKCSIDSSQDNFLGKLYTEEIIIFVFMRIRLTN